ncbi:hypothetical protein [Mycolicibacter terrae]|uniref:hypothetical protein n=1 Tax=Mycolicibacter terrae TaxID=1788 RepID=UPI001F210239|nr:hypothetical protein [Mycolicibacter terrae]
MSGTEQTQTPVPGPERNADGQTVPPQGIDTGEPENGSQEPKSNREARYRVERNEARAERDELAQRVAVLQTRELERIAAEHISNPADLLTLSGKTLADFLGEDGELDTEAVVTAANDLLGTRPGLRKPHPATDLTQGQGGTTHRGQPAWADLLRN